MKQSQTAPLSSTKSKATSSFFPNELVIKKKERKAKHTKKTCNGQHKVKSFQDIIWWRRHRFFFLTYYMSESLK